MEEMGTPIVPPDFGQLKVLVVDDEVTYRNGLRHLLGPFRENIRIVGEAGDGEAAIAELKRVEPDVVLLDLKLPWRAGMFAVPRVEDGLATIEAIRREAPAARILILTYQETELDLFRAVRAGARGYLAKREVREANDLIEPLILVGRGRAYFGREVAELIHRFFELGMGPEPTHDELDALESVARGAPCEHIDDTILEKVQSSAGGNGDKLGELVRPQDEAENVIEAFFSYAHVDEPFRASLVNHLAILRRLHVLQEWHDRMIGAGDTWANAIDDRLNRAHLILLLVSSDFLASDYCWGVEMKRALERHETGEARVIPVILRPCEWRDAPFGKLHALPRDARAISTWPDPDEALMSVAQGVRMAVEELRSRRHRAGRRSDSIG
jgi:DNA-binding NarL/FixJ family response regulator